MSRPTRQQAVELKHLEGAATQLAEALKAAGVLTVRLRQMYRRMVGMDDLIAQADVEIARIVDCCDTAKVSISTVINTRQDERSAH